MVFLFIVQGSEATCLPLSILGCSGFGVEETLLARTSVVVSSAGESLPVSPDQVPSQEPAWDDFC